MVGRVEGIKTCLNPSKFYQLKKNHCCVDAFSSGLSKIKIWIFFNAVIIFLDR